MKKFLLLALLTMGATSFAGVEGTATDVQLPVTVSGNIIDGATTNLIIEALDNASIDGKKMEFSTGDMKPGSKHSFNISRFTIKRANGSVFSDKDTFAVGVGTSDKASAKTVKTTTNGKKITFTYDVAGAVNAADKSIYDGTVKVGVDVEKDASSGVFVDSSKPIVVKLTTTP